MAQRNYNWGDAFTFGKYRGEAVDDICVRDPGWIIWALNNDVIKIDERLKALLDRQP